MILFIFPEIWILGGRGPVFKKFFDSGLKRKTEKTGRR